MSQSRALITGASGFTGRYVASELEAAGFKVTGLSYGGGQSALEDICADVLDRQALREVIASVSPDVVLHLAGISFVAHGDVDEIYRVNVSGTRNLLEALASLIRPPSLVVLASSANVYGNATVEPVTEDTPASPTNDYAVSKLAMEYMASLWKSQLPIVITRPFNYTGIGQSEQFLLPKIVSHFRRKESSIELGNTDVFRDFGDVRDVARVYRKLVETRPAGSVLNICSGVGHSLDEILETMAAIAGYHIDVKINPAFVRKEDVRRLIGSNRALFDAIGFVPSIPLSETLSWMYGGE
ncbi:NAD-dependent epimerase/dehydratase family protein [Dyella sp. M7H15-1]|uniref:GDP-mannose 4,6-dehydratase n=1 Tax=Dyella sp. M7H15-1 TaxID=2501295 RepID=UPI001004EC42|nr:GDP-mannose 4,6-dehydratase [Dyella sp. M7H15-1]QAU24989.1 NAD-dependent epimerase/dehydratase family protein [Dyella sp. M7H15-1]